MPGQDALSAALANAAAGWPTFPTRPDDPSCPGGQGLPVQGTVPGHARMPGRLHRPGRDPGMVAPLAGRRTCRSRPARPGPDVLDVDVKPDGDGWAAFNRLKRAGLLAGAKALVRTPSGGLHSYYAGSAQRNGKLPRHHIDFRSAGGYVLAPPSRVHGRPYELLDHRAGACGRIRLAGGYPAARPAQAVAARPRGRAAGDLGKLAAWVAAQQEGNRNDGLFWAACRAAEAGHGDLERPGGRCGYRRARRGRGAPHRRQRGPEGGSAVNLEDLDAAPRYDPDNPLALLEKAAAAETRDRATAAVEAVRSMIAAGADAGVLAVARDFVKRNADHGR